MTTMPATPLDHDVEDRSVPALRGSVAKRAGTRTNWQTPLDKETLNSTYAHLTGGFYVPKAALHKPSHPMYADRKEILVNVASEARVLSSHNSEDWRGERRFLPDQLRRAELLALVEEMSDRGDQREWAG
jgi:hypothetical protein